ncbi:MAG: hypothetical protein ABFS12_16810, partial [Bacteroidota bacterium]
TTDNPITSVGELNGQLFAVMDKTIYRAEENGLKKVNSSPSEVNKLKKEGGNLWALSSKGLYKLNEDKWEQIDNREFVDITIHLGVVHAATKEEIFKLENDKLITTKPEAGYFTSNTTMMMEDGTQLLADPVRLGPIKKIASYSGTIYVLRPGRLVLFDGKMVNVDFIDWGKLPSRNTNDMIGFGSRLFISTDRGLSVLRGAALTTLKGSDGLPYENTTCLEKGFNGDLWIGTTKGAIRMTNDEWQYFGTQHWLPSNNVHDIAVGNNAVYVATDKGIGIIKYEQYTLHKKANYYERHIREWGHKRLGFTHTLYKRGDEWIREVSDNDGGHTATYLAAMSYKYAVTGDESARKEAVESFKAMLWLERITPIDGFIARAIWSSVADKDEKGRHGSGGLPAKWYPTEDSLWYWKGDTSSDEVIAHFYAVSLFHDLVAEGKEKELAKEHIARVAEYIIENGWVYIDMDGKTTRWGRWNPEYLLRPYGWVDRGVNGLEAMTFAKTAYNLTGDKKFEDGFNQLLKFGYQNHLVRQKNTFPPESIAPWDDNLAFRSYYTIFRYVDDPYIRSVLLRSIERSYEVKRLAHFPWFNFAYGAISGNDCEVDKAVKHLREMPLDCIEYSYTNSFRDDLQAESGYTGYEGVPRALSPREKTMSRSSSDVLRYDGGSNGRRVIEPSGYLRAYWMGRYHGFIKAPKTDDSEIISVPESTGKTYGADPYDGPEMPELY